VRAHRAQAKKIGTGKFRTNHLCGRNGAWFCIVAHVDDQHPRIHLKKEEGAAAF